MVRKYESTLFSHFWRTESMKNKILPFLTGRKYESTLFRHFWRAESMNLHFFSFLMGRKHESVLFAISYGKKVWIYCIFLISDGQKAWISTFRHFLWATFQRYYTKKCLFLLLAIAVDFSQRIIAFCAIIIGFSHIVLDVAKAKFRLLLLIRRLKPTVMVKTNMCVCGVCAVEEMR